jgi:hypothetical protein
VRAAGCRWAGALRTAKKCGLIPEKLLGAEKLKSWETAGGLKN